MPKFTIITSTFNVAAVLPATANSLRAQTCQDFEWIIADGASTDATMAVVSSYGSLAGTVVSEPDTGIYQAWNKVLRRIEGEWVLFLGAGDALFDEYVLEKVKAAVETVDADATTLYGNVLLVESVDAEVGMERNEIWQGLKGPWAGGRPVLPCHQGVFHRATLFHEGFRFDERCRISADNEIILRELIRGHGRKLELSISRFHVGGISGNAKNRVRMIAESIYINYKLGIFRRRPFYQLALLGRNLVKHIFATDPA